MAVTAVGAGTDVGVAADRTAAGASGASEHSGATGSSSGPAAADPTPVSRPVAKPVSRPFSRRSPWNTPIPAQPVLDPRSERVVRYLGAVPGVADLYDYGVPVYDADRSRAVEVTCARDWGTCDLEQRALPLPRHARPSRGSDGALAVVDPRSNRVLEFWRANPGIDRWTTEWGHVVDLRGRGRGGATGAGVSLLGGVVRAAEVEAGEIRHALAISTDNACRRVTRYPATKTDGLSGRADCVPEGARLQLDPTIDLAAIPGITPAEVAIGRALQRYGAYVRDNGGARVAVIFEVPTDEPDPYPQAGLRWDYYAMSAIPWSRLRLLRSWNGS